MASNQALILLEKQQPLDPQIFPFDHPEFIHSMPQVGQPLEPGLAVLRRNGLPGGFHDSIGPLPYSQQLAGMTPASLRRQLDRHELVAFLAILKPGTASDREAWIAAGFEAEPASPQFVWRPGRELSEHSAKTRHNLRRAREQWRVEPCDVRQYAGEMGVLYAELFARREMSALLRYPRAHFARLAAVPGIEMLGAFDAAGLGAFLIYARWQEEVHTLHLVGAERSYRTRAAYALFQALWEREHAQTTLYFGGAPRAANGAGIARFKQRFANATEAPLFVRALLDPAASQRLQEQRGSYPWFPPYRSQHGD